MFGITLPLNQYGTKVSSFWKDLGIDPNYLDIEDEKNIEFQKGDFNFWLEMYMGLRWDYQYKPLRGKNQAEVMNEYKLNIHANEILYFTSKGIDWYEEKTVSTNVSYSGFRFRAGEAMSFNTGSFDVVKKSVTDFVLLSRGSLYITNQRIIFISDTTTQNRTVPIDDILEFSIYKDGVLLGKPNGKKPLILVPGFANSLVPRDDLNSIIRILYRLMSGNENEDITPPELKN